MLSRLTRTSLFLSALACLPAAAAHPTFTVHIVGAPGSWATSINAAGTVVGNYPFSASVTHGFVNTGTSLADLGTFGGETYATDINDHGEIVGMSFDSAGQRRAFLYKDGSMQDLGTLGGEQSSANAINNRGDIVGWAQLPHSEASEGRAFLLRRGSSMQDLGRFEVPDAEGDSGAYGINERRQVVGGSALGPYIPTETPYHAFVYACEEMRDLGTLGGTTSTARAINALGQVVGDASTPDFRHNRAFLFYRGTLHNLGTLKDGDYSAATDINDHGQVVGTALGTTGSTAWERGFLYQDGSMRSLTSLLAPGSGWTISGAAGINASGQIAGTGCKAGVCYALRLDPLP